MNVFLNLLYRRQATFGGLMAIVTGSALLCTILFSTAVMAQVGNAANGKVLFTMTYSCSGCHGEPPDARASRGANNPTVIANAFKNILAMQGFGFNGLVTPSEIIDIAAYLAFPNIGLPIAQTITMATISSQLLTLGSVTMATPPTATSGMTVSLASITPAICTVSGTTVTMWLGGTCSIAANQAGGTVGSTNYAAALQVVRSFVISAPAPVALSKRGGTDIAGQGKSSIVVRSVVGQTTQMQAGQLAGGQITFTPMIDPGADFRLLGITDFAGNGKSDLAIQNMVTLGELGEVRTWMDFLPNTDARLRDVKRAWAMQAVGDLDGDGLGDLVFRWTGFTPDRPGDTGVSYIWFTNPVVGGLPEVRKRGGAPLDWTLLGAADINFDGAADILYISPAGQIRVLMATNDRTCANLLVGNMPAGFTALKFADFTGGRRGDILLRNATTGEVSLMSLNAAGYTLPIGVVITNPDAAANAPCTSSALVVATSRRTLPVADPTWQFYASGDLDGDGIMDIVWLRPDNTLVVWLMNAGGAAPTVLPNVGTAPVGFSVFQP